MTIVKTNKIQHHYNKSFINALDNMNNTIYLLYGLKLVYYFNEARPQIVRGIQTITWNDHIQGRANCGSAFTSLDQYAHILNTGAFHCVLFDGSIIRSSFGFIDNILVSHSHLWWPAPYIIDGCLTGENTPQNAFEEFITDLNWRGNVRMRSPIRIDFDPNADANNHPQVHMHTQHHESRVSVDNPICFAKFIKFIFQNYYPHLEIDYSGWNNLNFSFCKPKFSQYDFSKIII